VFQEVAAKGKNTLPVTVVYAAVMALLAGMTFDGWWKEFVCIIIATFLMVIINNNNVLIRVYSRLPSSIFLVLAVMLMNRYKSFEADIALVLFAAHLLLLFRTYQDKQSMGTVCTAFILIGAISTVFMQILYFVPIIWLLLGTYMQAGSLKNYAASLAGLLVPYWLWGTYGFCTGNYEHILEHIASIAVIQPVDGSILEPHLLLNIVFISVLGICGAAHFARYSYHDSIKTRMMFYSLIVLFLLTVVFIVLQPQYDNYLLRLLAVTAAPITAHYFTFTKSRFHNCFFIVCIAIAILLTVYNTWMA
jgi:hypothetical protein